MEDSTSLWNTKTIDLTVGDVVKLNLAVPAIMVGTLVGITVVAAAVSTLRVRLQQARAITRQDNPKK